MTTSALDDMQRTRFEWPEPLVLELIGEAYGAHDDGDRWMAVRWHARYLRSLVGHDTMPTPAARLELIACCAARGINAAAIEAAEQIVFDELLRLVLVRFRNSPRLGARFVDQLQSARAALPKRPEPPRKPVAPAFRREPLRLRPLLATA